MSSSVIEPQIKERPILFSGEMVRAILAGRKTQTRRVLKPDPFSTDPRPVRREFEQGMRLWVRETFLPVVDGDPPGWYEYAGSGPDKMGYDGPDTILYRSTDDHYPKRWRPGIYMPRWASRITLEITNVRIERVQSMIPSEAFAEGFESTSIRGLGDVFAFKTLWDKLNEKRGFWWEKNPWVWVVEFKRLIGEQQ
jgi:hypothetical protein